MSIRLDYDVASRRFKEALELAKSGVPLPTKWIQRTKKLGSSPSRTFIAMLGTALLAKATDPKIDPFALKVREFPTAYSARSLCKDVLVPSAVEAGVHLGTTGREPLNNQPFFRHERVGPDMVVRRDTRPHLDFLCDCLLAASRLDSRQSLEALAAFLRVRLDERVKTVLPRLGKRVLGVPNLTKAASDFLTRDPEHGKRGQALVAACLNLVFHEVQTSRVYDPSRHWPGDVAVLEDGVVTLVAEVKQRPATGTEILQFVARCNDANISRAILAALHPDQPTLPVDELRRVAWHRYQVHLSVLEDAAEAIRAALTWTARPLDDALTTLPRLVAVRLQELEVSQSGLTDWAALFQNRER
jgi:hypothetical protein